MTDVPDWAKDPPAQSDVPDWAREPEPMSAGDVASQAAGNFGGSLAKYGTDLYQAVRHPIDTASNIGNLLQGMGEKQQSKYAEALGKPMAAGQHEKYADAMGSYLGDRYGGIENIKKSFAQDPVGVLSDLSLPVTGGGSMLARAPGIAGRAGEIAATAGRLMDPVNATAQVARLAKYPIKGLSAVQSGAGAPALEEAYGAGLAGGPRAQAFRDNITGRAQLTDVVDEAKQGLANMRQQRSAAYNREMDRLRLSENQFDERDRILDFGDIDKAVNDAEKVQTFSGRHGAGPTQVLDPGANDVRTAMTDQIEHWKGLPPADYHTAEGLDALKKQLYNTMRSTQPGTPARAAGQRIYNAVKGTIAQYYPVYTEIMGQYQQASQELDEVTRALSLGEKATADTSLKKLQSLLRDNVSTSFAHRAQLGQRLVEAGAPNLRSALAGQALQTFTPRGLGKHAMQNLIPAITGMLGYGTHGGIGAAAGAAATLPFMMPRVVGEGAYAAGATRRLLAPYLRGASAAPPALRDLGVMDQQPVARRAGGRIHKGVGGELSPDDLANDSDNPYPDADWSKMNQPSGELKEPTYTPTERISNAFHDALTGIGASPSVAGHLTEGFGGLANMTPLGIAGSAMDTVAAKARGDNAGVIEGMAGMIPGAKPEVAAVKAAARRAEQAIEERAGEEIAAAAGRKGLSFPEEQSADRLRLKMQRDEKVAAGATAPGEPSNARTVIKAPEGSDLPDFVAGKVTPEDWVNRAEHMLTPDEIHKSAKWYDEIYDNFLQQTHGDEQKARQYMRGWLVAQQNVDVSGAMRNTLLQREQILRGVPEDKMIGSGMPNPTLAARRVMQGRDIEEGVGQKIADFVDSAEGSDTRSWMGHHPNGGQPFVVDVHTARDTGMVDQELKNHLTRLGYDKKDIAKLKTDLGTSPSKTQYENRGDFGRNLTDYLNERNWQGRSDWTPREVQAVGWMGMTKLTANKADDVATGLSSQMRHLSMEVAPGEGSPWATKYGDRFSALPPADQYKITHAMTQDAIDRASKMAGTDVRDIVHGTGGWMNFQNPSTVAQTFASPQGAEITANALGHMLQQTEVWSNKVKPPTTSPKGFAVDIMASGNHRLGTDEGLREMWGKIMAADPTGKLFQGYQPIVGKDGRVGIRALIDRGGVKTKADLENALSGSVDKVLKSLPGDYESRLGEAEITKARNDWTKDPNGNAYTQRLVHLLGRDPTADLGRHGQELEEQFRKAIEAAEARTAGAKKARGGVASSYARGGRVAYRWPLATAPPPLRTWYGQRQ